MRQQFLKKKKKKKKRLFFYCDNLKGFKDSVVSCHPRISARTTGSLSISSFIEWHNELLCMQLSSRKQQFCFFKKERNRCNLFVGIILQTHKKKIARESFPVYSSRREQITGWLMQTPETYSSFYFCISFPSTSADSDDSQAKIRRRRTFPNFHLRSRSSSMGEQKVKLLWCNVHP